MSLHSTPAKKSSGQKAKTRKTPTAYLQPNSGQLHEAVQRSDADKYMKGKLTMTDKEIYSKLIEQMDLYVKAFEDGISYVSEGHAKSRKRIYHESMAVIQDTARLLCTAYESEVNAHASECRIAIDEIWERYYE